MTLTGLLGKKYGDNPLNPGSKYGDPYCYLTTNLNWLRNRSNRADDDLCDPKHSLTFGKSTATNILDLSGVYSGYRAGATDVSTPHAR